jgi:hypothetical protein
LRLREKSIPGQNVPRKTYSVVWEYGGKNGKAAKPSCFKNTRINNLPVIWRNKEKAWVTAATIEEWLNMLNTKRRRKIEMPSFFLTMLPATQR